MAGSIHVGTEEVPISEHPDFYTKRDTWGVVAAHWLPAWFDTETGEAHMEEHVPEDRSGHRPDLDGLSMADMWDCEKDRWRIQPPGMEGVTRFLRVTFNRGESCHAS